MKKYEYLAWHLKYILASIAILIAALNISCASSYEITGNIEAEIGESVTDSLYLGDGFVDISVEFQGDFSDWVLSPLHSPAVKQGTLVVKGEGSWKISVTSDTGGYMAESDDNGYIPLGLSLHTPMTIIAQGGNAVNLSQGGILFQGSGQKTVPITLEQPVVWNDEPLPQGHEYKSLISFVSYRD